MFYESFTTSPILEEYNLNVDEYNKLIEKSNLLINKSEECALNKNCTLAEHKDICDDYMGRYNDFKIKSDTFENFINTNIKKLQNLDISPQAELIKIADNKNKMSENFDSCNQFIKDYPIIENYNKQVEELQKITEQLDQLVEQINGNIDDVDKYKQLAAQYVYLVDKNYDKYTDLYAYITENDAVLTRAGVNVTFLREDLRSIINTMDSNKINFNEALAEIRYNNS